MTTSKSFNGDVRKWTRYPDRKPVDIDWCREIPCHWSVAALKRFARFQSGDGITSLEIEPEGEFPVYGGNGLRGYTSKYTHDGDFVLLGRQGALCGNVKYASGRFWASEHAVVVTPSKKICLRWYGELLRAMDLGRYSMSAAQPGLSVQFVVNLLAPIPPLDEQQWIVAFLDRETTKIDALIAKKERLIELLQEKRTALISHAVAKGIDPSVPMKDSGVAWLGEIPAHWDIIQSRRVFKVRNDPAWDCDEQLTASQKYGMLPQTEFMELEGRRVVVTIKGVESLRHVEPNDFVISLRSFQGGIEWCKLRGSVTFHYVVLKPVKTIHPAYFGHLFKSSVFIQALRATTDFIRDGQDLRYSHFILVPLPVVPMDEQAAIAEFLDKETAKLDSLINVAQKTIDLLREYRTALISAAVTGKIDVREEVA